MRVNPLAVITGAARGIGRAIVDAFLGRGWEVIGLDLNEDPLQPGVTWHVVDLAVSEHIDRVARDVLSGGRDIAALVNNAGIQRNPAIHDTDADTWDAVQAVNVRSAHLLTRALLPALAGGCVVNVASVHALATAPRCAAYAASKAALLGWTRAAAVELARSAVRVNAVLPGAIDTSMLREGLSGGGSDLGDIIARTPLGRVGQPEEVAHAVVFLSDPERASFITGQTLTIDGGVMSSLPTASPLGEVAPEGEIPAERPSPR